MLFNLLLELGALVDGLMLEALDICHALLLLLLLLSDLMLLLLLPCHELCCTGGD